MAGENCSSGCHTKDHLSWGECVRAKDTRSMCLGGTTPSFSEERRFRQDTERYRQVVKAGGSLSTAMNKGVDVALRQIGVDG